MLWPTIIILYIGIIICVLLYLINLHKSVLSGPDFKQDENALVFSLGNEFSKPMELATGKPEKRFAFFDKVEKSDKKHKIKRTDNTLTLFEKKHTRASIRSGSQNINIANVTRDLISIVLKMSDKEKHRLLIKKTGHQHCFGDYGYPKTITKQLIEMIMSMSLADRCGFLGECKSRIGMSRRKFDRKDYMTPVYFVVKGLLQNAYTKNISNDGVLIETLKVLARKFFPGESITMNFAHPQSRKERRIQGKITRVTPSAIAVCFDEPL